MLDAWFCRRTEAGGLLSHDELAASRACRGARCVSDWRRLGLGARCSRSGGRRGSRTHPSLRRALLRAGVERAGRRPRPRAAAGARHESPGAIQKPPVRDARGVGGGDRRDGPGACRGAQALVGRWPATQARRRAPVWRSRAAVRGAARRVPSSEAAGLRVQLAWPWARGRSGDHCPRLSNAVRRSAHDRMGRVLCECSLAREDTREGLG